MPADTRALQSVLRRLEKLERQNRQLRRAGLTALIAIVGLALTAQAPPNQRKTTDSPLLTVHRIYVEGFGDSEPACQIQAMVISSLVQTNRFTVTEDRNSADAVLKGSATELSSQELRASSEETAHAAAVVGGAVGAANSASQKDSAVFTETIYNARLSVRLVNQAGDVIWAATEDTRGSKYRAATADLADKAVARLVREAKRAQSGDSSPVPSGPVNPLQVLRNASGLFVVVSGDKAMESEINNKLLKWGRLALVSAGGQADLTLEVTQTGKYNMMRSGSAVTASAVLRDSETGTVLWSATKGGVWSMSGTSTRHVGRQIADELIKFLDSSRPGSPQ